MSSKAITPTHASSIRLIDKATLCAELAIGERTLENMVRAGAFPPPVRIGKRAYWTENAVRLWQQRQFSMQEAWVQR